MSLIPIIEPDLIYCTYDTVIYIMFSSSSRAPKILYIAGVFIEDLIGHPIKHSRKLTAIKTVIMPSIYNRLTWPKKCYRDCNECYKPITNAPLFIPLTIFKDSSSSINMMLQHNELFCGLACATVSVKKNNLSYFDQVEKISLIEFLIDDMSSAMV